MKIKFISNVICIVFFSKIVFSSVNTQLVFVSNTYDTPEANKGTLIIDVQAISSVSSQQILGFQDAFQLDANLKAQYISSSFSNEYFSSTDYDPSTAYRTSDGRVSYIYTVKSGQPLSTISTSWVTIVRITIVYTMTNQTSTVNWFTGFPDFAVSNENGSPIAGVEEAIPSGLINFALPVELSSFTVSTNQNAVNLKWQTKTEVNNYGFEVERKVGSRESGVGSWEKIGFVNGHGNSNSSKDYSLTDKNPSGGSKFIYRLKQIDNDGKFEYSKEVEVELVPNEFNLFQNYPNPFNPVTNFKYAVPKAGNVTISIYSILGEKIKDLVTGFFEPGIYTATFDGSDFSSGTYIYIMQAESPAGGFVQVKKMLLLK